MTTKPILRRKSAFTPTTARIFPLFCVMHDFNPSEIAVKNGNIFGFPYNQEEAEIHIIPVAWEATASFGRGCAASYEAIRQASLQLDFYNDKGAFWKVPVFMQEAIGQMLNDQISNKAAELIQFLEEGGKITERQAEFDTVNNYSQELNALVKKTCLASLETGKKVLLIGGDHSIPLGYLQALNTTKSFGILHFDAHADMRPGYEGFVYSHASIMHHAKLLSNIESITSIGLRDISPEEAKIIRNDSQLIAFSDKWMAAKKHQGTSFIDIIHEILSQLPPKIYISFDVDCLDPSLCPNTGTPVPGGLTWHEIQAFIDALYQSDIEIIGADICETGNHPWDAQISARLIYQFIGLLHK